MTHTEGYDWVKIIKSSHIMSAVILSGVCVLGVVGNGVVIWATGFRMKKTVSTVWYLNLAVADFLVTAFLPLKITYYTLDEHWPFDCFMCKMEGFVFLMNMYASVYTLAVISVDRCVGVVCPFAWCSGYRSVRKASWVSLAVWVMALAPSMPYFIFRDTRPVNDKVRCYNNYALVADYYNQTAEEKQLYDFRFPTMVVTRFLVGFVVPFSVVSCYSVIIYRLRNRPLVSQSGSSSKSYKIIATVIAAFFLCWIPIHIIWLIGLIHYQSDLIEYSDTLRLVLNFGVPITFTLALLNSCLNPLLYVFSQGFNLKGVFRSRSILKVLEKAFSEEPPQANNTPTDPDVTRPMIALSETESEGNTGPPGTQDPSGDCPV